MKQKRITIRLSEEEYRAIEIAAEQQDVQISTYARKAIQESLTGRHENKLVLTNDCIRAKGALGLAQWHIDAVLQQLGVPKTKGKI